MIIVVIDDFWISIEAFNGVVHYKGGRKWYESASGITCPLGGILPIPDNPPPLPSKKLKKKERESIPHSGFAL